MITIVIEMPKDSEVRKYEFIILKEKEDLINCLDEIARETVFEGIYTKDYKESYIITAFHLLYGKLKNTFQNINKASNNQFLHLNVRDILKEDEVLKDVSQTKELNILRNVEAFINLWLFRMCTSGLLSKKYVYPRISINVTSKIVQKNSHLIKSDLALLALYGSTDSSLEILEGLNLISDQKKGLLSNFLDHYRKKSPKRSDYRPNSVYTFREYMLKHGVKQRVKLSTNQRPIVSTFLSC